MASTSSVPNGSTAVPVNAPPPLRHARVLGAKKGTNKVRPGPLHLRVSSDSSVRTENGSLISNGSQPASPARLDSPVSLVGSVESSSSVTSDETSAAQNTTLTCPICGESMVTLLQLNRHIDDVHSQIEKTEEDEIKSWFKKKVDKAKQLQNMTSVFSTKFSKLDLFDLDDSGDGSSTTLNAKKTPSAAPVMAPPPIIVTKAHWQKPTGLDKCSDIVCEKPLNTRNGIVNCRQCGKLFCSLHTKYQMKLDKGAHHDPQNGVWSRVCETCYKSRPGYSDTTGVSRDLFSDFVHMRQARIDRYDLEVNKLEKRLIKLIKVLLDPKFTSEQTNVFSYSKATQRRNAERQIIVWEEDADVSNCPICQNQFGYSLRKHHCRLCGRVVCASHTTNCSRDAPISILITKLGPQLFDKQKQAKLRNDISIRICVDCKNTVFSKRNFASEVTGSKPELLRFYDTLKPIKRSIEIALPKFQSLLTEINDPEKPPAPELLHEASRIRRRLLDSFVQFDTMSRKVMTIHVNTDEEARLQKQIYNVAAQYLQENMLPLKALPKILKHSKPSQLSKVDTASTTPGEAAEAESQGAREEESPLPPQEIQALREQLIVLEEQKFLVQGMITEANHRRKFDEVAPLQQSIDDLDNELANIRATLGANAI